MTNYVAFWPPHVFAGYYFLKLVLISYFEIFLICQFYIIGILILRIGAFAKNMLIKDCDISLICDVTGLSEEEIKKLKDAMYQTKRRRILKGSSPFVYFSNKLGVSFISFGKAISI